ncbi:MAG: DUF4397 domain-containing protein [Deltaproteobacteria bacterium]|nr:DUF4397 domain-containing protein [Deltaproteobacteria bacterium]
MKLNSNVKLSGTFALLALLSFATGCGDDEKETTTDTDTGSDTGSGSDTGTTDTGTTDTGTTDTGTDTDTTVSENTKIRVFHASDLANTASEPGVDIYTGDTLVVDALAYEFGTGFLEVPAGDYAFNVFADGAGPTGDAALAIPSLSYAADAAYTLVAYDNAGAIAPLRLDESTATIGAGNIRVRAIHAAGILPEVDIWNVTDAANPAVLFENLAFGAATAQVEIPAAAYVLGIDLNNDATPDVLIDVPALPAGTSANIFAVADAEGPHLVADLGAGQGFELFAQVAETNIRVFHGAPSAGTVDIYTGGSAVIPGLEALAATNYVTVPEGDYSFDVFAAGADPTGTPAFSIPSLNYAADASYTAVAYESGTGFAALRLDEPAIAPAAGNIRVRAVHIANGVGQVDIWNITDPSAPSPLIVDFNFGTATDFLEIPAQAYTLGLDVNNDGTPDLTFSIPPLPAGTVANLYAIVGENGPFLAGQLGATVVPIFPDAGPTNIRVFHASTIANGASAPGVDIYTGGTRAVANFTYLSATDYLSVPAGNYNFDVFAAGEDPISTPALAIPSLAYDADAFYTLVAYDNTGSIAGIRLDDSNAPIAAGLARVQIVHVADTVPQVDVLSIDSLGAATTLLSDLSFGTSSGTLDVPAGAYTVGLDVNNDLAADVIYTLPELTAGANATVYAIKDATGPFLAVQLGTTVLGPIRPN